MQINLNVTNYFVYIMKIDSCGVGNPKFFGAEIGRISGFGRTSATSKNLIIWDSGI